MKVREMQGLVVLVTGGARGQGASHAATFADAGAQVVVADVRDEEGELLVATLRARGGHVRYVHLDVTEAAAWSRVIEDMCAREGGLDVLINNAGIIRVTPLAEVPLAEWELIQRVNTTSALLGIQAATPAMKARGGGSIINVGSTAAHRGAAGYGAYSASKAALIALTRAAALELAPSGIRVNSISPGGVETPMNNDEPPGGTSSDTPLGRRARPDEISPLVAYLATSASSYVTGSDFVIDGGLTIR